MSQSRWRRRKAARARRRVPWAAALLAAGGVVLLAAAFYAQAARRAAPVPVEVTGAPHLKVDRRQVDLGDVPLGRTVEVSFQLANAGDQPLRITEPPYVAVMEGC